MPEWIGKTIGNVRIEKLLARGGMAEVYLGSHLNLERPVAVKLLHSYIEEEPLLLERFQREARVVAGLRHSNIVQIFDFDTIDGHPYIVMEYLKGPTLATYLRHLHQRKKRIPPDQVARILNELAVALDYAHGQGVVHRDIKPGNIMLHNKTDDIPLDKPLTSDVEAVITDFGLVRIMNTTSQTVVGTVSGTPAYMSPEQALGDPTDHRTDIYSLGIVLYEMLAGRVPFDADSTLTVLHMQIHTPPPPIQGVSAPVQAVIDRALFKNPDDRYQTSRELAVDFYHSIGMTLKVDTIREPYPVRPIEVPAPTKVEPAPKPEQQTNGQPTVEPEPQIKAPAMPMSEPEPEKKPPLPTNEPERQIRPLPISEPEQQKKPEPVKKSEPEAKPQRRGTWIRIASISAIGLAILGIAAFLIIPRSSSPPSTATANPVIPITSISPSPSPASQAPDRTRMVEIPAGTYWVGKDPAGNFNAASRSITLPAFWIDQYPVTNQQFQQFMPERQIPPGRENYPVMGVKWDEAEAYCKWLNKRLPGEAEWEVAGRGPGENPPLYPWGAISAPPTPLPNHEYPVGSFSFNRSEFFEVYDLIGNVYEWVGEPYYASVDAGKKLLRGVRASVPEDITFRVQVTLENTNYLEYAGFRCAADQVR